MSVIAEFTVPYDDFALGRLMEVNPGITVELESIVPTGTAVMPYFWVDEANAGDVKRALGDDPLVTDIRVVDRVESEVLFRVDWTTEINGLIDALLETDAAVLGAVGMGDDWSFRLRFADRESMSTFYQQCREGGIALGVDSIHNPATGGGGDGFGLTDGQREALTMAYEAGFFEVPRRTTLGDLAERLGVSDTAVSQRLRRGLSQLLGAVLVRESHTRTDED